MTHIRSTTVKGFNTQTRTESEIPGHVHDKTMKVSAYRPDKIVNRCFETQLTLTHRRIDADTPALITNCFCDGTPHTSEFI
jgi:hypothetical protein